MKELYELIEAILDAPLRVWLACIAIAVAMNLAMLAIVLLAVRATG